MLSQLFRYAPVISFIQRAQPLVHGLERRPGYRKVIVVEKTRGGGKAVGNL